MTYQNVWWHPNYVEYGSGLNPPKTWPNVMEQYRRPSSLYDLRYYDLPTENYESMLYYRYPRMGQPVYRGTFRDKPHCVPKYYPEMDPTGKPKGFHGRMYYEHGPPQFKSDGPKKDDLYWLERPPLLPTFPGVRRPNSSDTTGIRKLESNIQTPFAPRIKSATENTRSIAHTFPARNMSTYSSDFGKKDHLNSTRRITQDGVGYL